MSRIVLAVSAASVILLISPFGLTAHAQAKKASDMYVIVKAQLYEVDEAFYKKVTGAKRLSKEDLEKLEEEAIDPAKGKELAAKSLFTLLQKQKPLQSWEDVNLDPGQEGEVLDVTKLVKCLPSPDQFGQNQRGPKTIREGVSLNTKVQVSADRRFVRVKFTERSVEIEDREKVVAIDENRKEVTAENVFLKESELSQVRDLPDGSSFLLPLQYRPRTAKDNHRYFVVLIKPRIYIEEEEKVRRAQKQNPN